MAVKISEIPVVKFFLILGIILIHSNVAINLPPHCCAMLGTELVRFITVDLTSACVPSFLIIAGYLFFANVDSFRPRDYGRKLKSRAHTLLVPYLFWNALCCVLLYFKQKYLGFPGLGVFEGDSVNVANLLKGFIALPNDFGMPYAFAFWFIRNLIALVVASPLAWLIGRKWWATIAVVILVQMLRVNVLGFQWFVTGAALALHQVKIGRCLLSGTNLTLCCALFLAGVLTNTLTSTQFVLGGVVHYIAVLLFLVVMINLAGMMRSLDNTRFGKLLLQSTFFLYAFHQTFVSVTRKFAVKVCGYNHDWQIVCAMLLSFVILAGVSFCVYLVLLKICPRFLTFVTGGRS